MVAAGTVVGFSNIWWLPVVAGNNGGGLFWMVYALVLLTVGTPLLIAELAIGVTGESDPVSASERIAVRSGRGRYWQITGWVGAVGGLVVAPLYIVAASWSAIYAVWGAEALFLGKSSVELSEQFMALVASPELSLWYAAAFVCLCFAVALMGALVGLGYAARLLVPIALALFVAIAYYSRHFGDMDATFKFLLVPDWHGFSLRTIFYALAYALFSIGLGKGVMMAIGRYIPYRQDIPVAALSIVIIELFVAILAGYVILPILFSANVEPAGGVALLFVGVPLAFSSLLHGELLLIALYLAVVIAAFTSILAFVEPAISVLSERLGLPRWLAVTVVMFVVWVASIGVIKSLAGSPGALWSWGNWFDALNRFAVWVIPLGSILAAVFMAFFVKSSISREEFEDVPRFIYRWWLYSLRWFALPSVLLVIFVAGSGSLTIGSPG